jgi:hypothetical protein
MARDFRSRIQQMHSIRITNRELIQRIIVLWIKPDGKNEGTPTSSCRMSPLNFDTNASDSNCCQQQGFCG